MSSFHTFRLRHEDKLDFIGDMLKWMKGSDVLTDQRCSVFNFGYKMSFPFPIIRLSLDSNMILNKGTFGTTPPSKCSFAVIGGKYLDQVGEVMLKEFYI